MGHKLRPTVIANCSAVLNFAERQIKDESPTFQPPVNLHDFLRESFILPFMVQRISLSTIASAWLDYWLKDGPAQSTNNASRDTSRVIRSSRRPHISHVSISVTIQRRLGLCELWLYTYLSRRANDIFSAQRPTTRSLCSAQSGNKKCKWHFYQLPNFKRIIR